MNIAQSILEALESLNANKMRSGLTILGIVIGVGAVIAMLAIGQGAQSSITGAITSIGTNILFVSSGNRTADVRNAKPLTLADAQAIADPLSAPDVAAVAPVIKGSGTITAGGQSMDISITGTTPEYFSLQNYSLLEGDFLTQDQQLGSSSVAVIGPGILHRPEDRHHAEHRPDVTVSPRLPCRLLCCHGGGHRDRSG
jgi:putative ABC transport system permease protein